MFRTSPRRLFETLRHLQGEQLLHQVLQRWKRQFAGQRPVELPGDLQTSKKIAPRVRRCGMRIPRDWALGSSRQWGIAGQVDLSQPWICADQGKSWNYPLHYFDELRGPASPSNISEKEHFEDSCRMLQKWLGAHSDVNSLPWEPYPTSLRIVNWLDFLLRYERRIPAGLQQRMFESMYVQVAQLARNLERHLLGTHLLKNLKALLLVGSFFEGLAADRWRAQAEELLPRELAAQFQADGSHVEPSAMYNCLAIEDLLDLLNFQPMLSQELRHDLRQKAEAGLQYLASISTPAGEYPMQGDAWPGAVTAPASLLDYGRSLGLLEPVVQGGLTLCASAAVAVWRREEQYLFADVGSVGPPHLSGHGHCDSLSFEWHVQGVPMIVDSGTFTYEAGQDRYACRSTAAHNTLQIDSREQHEIWAAFRVGRRSQVTSRAPSSTEVSAELVPWFDQRLRWSRSFRETDQGLTILDHVSGPGSHCIDSRFHLHPDCEFQVEGKSLKLNNKGVDAVIDLEQAPNFMVQEARSSGSRCVTSDGVIRPNAVLLLHHEGPLPFQSNITLKRKVSPQDL